MSSEMSTTYCIIPTEGVNETPNKLFIGGIPAQTTEKELNEFFCGFGPVTDVRIVTDRLTAECKGYGFVTFVEQAVTEKLVELKSIRMKGRKLRIRRAVPRSCSQFDPVLQKENLSVPESPFKAPLPESPYKKCAHKVLTNLTPPPSPQQMPEPTNQPMREIPAFVYPPPPYLQVQPCGEQFMPMPPHYMMYQPPQVFNVPYTQ